MAAILSLAGLSLLGGGLESPVRASDWPQLLGPTANAVYAGQPLAREWPPAGPPILWRVTVGEGYSCPVVGDGRLIVSHRLGDDLIVDARKPQDGSVVWTFKHPMKFQDGAHYDSGPRPTPVIRDGRVYVHNSDGYLACLDLKDGRKVWSRQARRDFQSSATWHGNIASPCLTEQAVILPVGGTNGAGIVAFSRATGETLWQVTDEKASGATPILATFGDRPQVLVVTRSALHGLDPASGRDFWTIPTGRQSSGNIYAASPIVLGDRVFVSGWYKLGATLLRVREGKPETLWRRDDALSTHYASAILYQDYAYGFHGHAWERGGPTLRCIELATGRVQWEQPQVGSGTLTRFDDHLLILSDNGELQLAALSPQGFKVKGRVQVVGRTTRSYPAIADGLAFIKGPKALACVDLRVP
jgi:outer membrane protein assembly factor BamB